MPIDPVTAGLIQTGAQTGGGIANALLTGRQNKKSREWATNMYNKQYADNLSFWNKQNEYNHPKNQMNRMIGSGLNPKLMYGQGSPGNAGPINTPDVQPVENRVPDFGAAVGAAGGLLNNIYDLRIKQAQTNVLDAQANNLNKSAALAGQEYDFLDAANPKKFQLIDNQVDKVFAETLGINEERQRKINAESRQIMLDLQKMDQNDQNLQNGYLLMLQNIKNLAKTDQQIRNLKLTEEAIRKDNRLRQIRIDTGDNTWLKIFSIGKAELEKQILGQKPSNNTINLPRPKNQIIKK